MSKQTNVAYINNFDQNLHADLMRYSSLYVMVVWSYMIFDPSRKYAVYSSFNHKGKLNKNKRETKIQCKLNLDICCPFDLNCKCDRILLKIIKLQNKWKA